MYAYIGRQAIFDRDKRVVGYELLYRDRGSGNRAVIQDGDAATRGVLSDAVTVFGISQLTNGKRAFINFTRDLLMNDFTRLADPKEVVVELEESVPVDDVLVGKLRELRDDGYSLALDNYAGTQFFDRILYLFDYVKVDFRQAGDVARRSFAQRLRGGRANLVAEKVETESDYLQAVQLGFQYFQGYYFEKPVRMTKQVPSLASSSYGMLMNELFKKEVDFGACCEVIQSDVVLTYMLLRLVQTANYYRGNVIDEIRDALVMMGTQQLQRWICLVLVRQVNITHSDEAPKRAYLRGRFIQRLMKYSNRDMNPQEGFILGMFSLLPQVTGANMEELLQGLNLSDRLKAALLGQEENEYTDFLQYAVIYEMENERLILPDIGLTLTTEDVATLYEKCQSATDKTFAKLGGGGA